MPGAELRVLAPCALHQSRLVVQSAQAVSNFLPNFCIWCDNQLCRNPTLSKSNLALPVHLDGNLLSRDFFRKESRTHQLIPFRCRLSSHCCCCHCCPRIQALLGAPSDASVMSVSCSKLRFASGTFAGNGEPLPVLPPSWWTPDSNAVDAGGARGCLPPPSGRCLLRGDSITPGSNTGARIPSLPPLSSNAFGANSLPCASSNKLPVHRSPGGNRLVVLVFITPLAVPKGTVFDPSIGPKNHPCSNRESKGPDDGWMGAKASTTLAHRTMPREEWRASPHFFRMLSCRLDQPQTDGACWWHTAQAKSTDHGLLAPQHTLLTPPQA